MIRNSTMPLERPLRRHAETGLALFVRNFRNLQEFNYTVHVSEEFNFIFFNNPKCGCSTTKATLNMECARRLGLELRYATTNQIHARRHNVLKTPGQIGLRRFMAMLTDPAVVRFCVLREPVNRVVSAFSNKFGWNSPQRQRFNVFVGRPAGSVWTVNEFAEAIASDMALRDFDEHWRLQFRQVCGALVDFTTIGFQETLDADLQSFARSVFGTSIDICDVRQLFPKNRSGGDAMAQLSPRSRQLLLTAYADDAEFYRREWARKAASSS
ncbi:MAG TPA: sulfotransferase family 2 domain-containing protein [Rhizomicrobium sp.]|jgi:hypothetical protein